MRSLYLLTSILTYVSLTLSTILYRIIDNKTLRLISESLGSPSKAEKVDNTLGGLSFFFSIITTTGVENSGSSYKSV